MTAVKADDPNAPRPVGRYEWEAIIRRLNLSMKTSYVALVMATYADPDGTRIRPTAPELAAAARMGESTVARYVRELRNAGLIVKTRRGGGRNGTGRPNEYRLTVPLDLLEKFEIRPLGPARIRVVPTVSPLTQGEQSNEDSPLTQDERPKGPSPVDNPVDKGDSPLTLVSAQTPTADEIDRSKNTVTETLTAQSDALTAHPWVSNYRPQDLPPKPTTTPDPTQPPTAREPTDDNPIELRPAKCQHGLPAHIRDNRPTCPLCRRLPTEEQP